ncbi:UNVERIFIED_ORG: hypothetical protein J2X79_004050 [Arthrobacter globiformis]|nr:hypothetical protein [Arthrobacter globiformis]
MRATAPRREPPGRIAIPVAADSWRQQPGSPAWCTDLGLEDLETALAAADRTDAPRTRDNLMDHFGSRSSAHTGGRRRHKPLRPPLTPSLAYGAAHRRLCRGGP